MEWILENWDVLMGALGGALALATAITRLTKSPKDDAVVAKIAGFLSLLEHKDVGGAKPPLRKAKRS